MKVANPQAKAGDTMKLGIQLYTVREYTDDARFRDTLRQLAAMGFRGVELAWRYGGMEPEALAEFLSSLGLECCGLHVPLAVLTDAASCEYAYARACGAKFITTSLASETARFPQLVSNLDAAGRVAQRQGLVLTYHNHHQEFAEQVAGQRAEDYLIAHTDPDLVRLELDLGWIRKGGTEPMAYWREHGLRTPQIHLRDYDVAADRVTDVGTGFIDLPKVLEQARELRTEWLIYEQDWYPVSAFDSCRACAALARACG
jgi:sugar phosphate isomerase/epimerase